MKTAKGLHLWVVDFGIYDPKLYITTRTRTPLIAVKRAQQTAKDQGFRSPLKSIEYKGTIDA